MPELAFDEAVRAHGARRRWVYNAMDCIATMQVLEELLELFRGEPDAWRYYRFQFAAQLPAFDMSMRGMLVDPVVRDERRRALLREIAAAEKELRARPEIVAHWDLKDKVSGVCPDSKRKDGRHSWERGVPDTTERKCEACGASRFATVPFNPQSPEHLKRLLYTNLNLPVQRSKDDKPTVDKEALQRLARRYPKLEPLISLILKVRDLRDQLSVLQTPLSPGGRWLSSFTVGQAWTGRWSSSAGAFGYGSNLQNIAPRHRRIFRADYGKLFCYADLKQIESLLVAHLAGDENYIRAHYEGDVHMFVAQMVWPEVEDHRNECPPWDPAPGHTYRFQAKRVQHGSNYGMSPAGMARWAHIPVRVAGDVQRRYFTAFPMIPAWHRAIRDRVSKGMALRFPLGYPIRLLGRPWDEGTVKQGLAVLPQGTCAHLINCALWRIWNDLPEVELLAQVHDAVCFQVPQDKPELAREAARRLEGTVGIVGADRKKRRARIRAELEVGRNWGKRTDDNPEGLEEWPIETISR